MQNLCDLLLNIYIDIGKCLVMGVIHSEDENSHQN